MTDINKISDLTAEQIGKLMRKAFAELLERISDGQDARDAISAIMQGFEPAYRETLAKSFSQALDTFVGASELVSYPVGEVSLSQALYQHARQTSAAVQRIVFEHAAGWHDARKLALDIFEGYGFKGGDDPLQWPKDSPKWPKYMRLAVVTDPASYRGWLNAAKLAAGEIKTPALKAAYSELLDAVEKGAGQKSLARKLDVAFQEQMRYRANRIAQTELHRQWMDRQAEEIMGDDTISVVQVRLADSHPKTDICDLFASQDKFGLGPGMYPKAKAPKPPFHPWCRCRWVSKRLLSADKAKEDVDSERKYLSTMTRQEGVSKAARVIGSKDKLLRVLNKKASVEEVFNQYRPLPYQLGRMGDNPFLSVPSQAAATAAGAPSAAMAAGPSSLEDFIKAGAKITQGMPADSLDAYDYIMRRLAADVGISTTCKTASRGMGAELVKAASRRFPDSWTTTVDQLGPLYVKLASPSSRGWCRTHDMDLTYRVGGKIISVVRGQGEISVRNVIENAVHEYSHRLQDGLPSLDKVFHELHAKRTAGDPLERLRDVSTLKYKPDEMTRRDKYIDPYYGKEYGNRGPLEMMTMSFQSLLSVRKENGFVAPRPLADFQNLLYNDRELFDLAVGLLFHWKP